MRLEDTLPDGTKVAHVGGEAVGMLKEFLIDLEEHVGRVLAISVGASIQFCFNDVGLIQLSPPRSFEISMNDLTRAAIVHFSQQENLYIDHDTFLDKQDGKVKLSLWIGKVAAKDISSRRIWHGSEERIARSGR